MSGYEICAVILIAGLTAHLVSCYGIVRMEKLMEKAMDDYSKKIQEIIKRKFL